MKSRLFAAWFTALVAGLLTGCGNLPTSLGKVPAARPIAEAYAGSPNYEKVDKFSFLQATLLYPANGGHHRLEIGERVLADAFDALDGNDVTLLRLLQFDAKCSHKQNFTVSVVCPASYTLELRQKGVSKTIKATMAEVNIGTAHAKEGAILIFPFTLGDDFYHRQVEPFLGALRIDLHMRIKDALTP